MVFFNDESTDAVRSFFRAGDCENNICIGTLTVGNKDLSAV